MSQLPSTVATSKYLPGTQFQLVLIISALVSLFNFKIIDDYNIMYVNILYYIIHIIIYKYLLYLSLK